MKKPSRFRVGHAIAATAGLIVFTAIYFHTGGGSGLWLAAQCGLGMALAIYFFLHLRDPGTSDGSV
jgi:hypothetical protein